MLVAVKIFFHRLSGEKIFSSLRAECGEKKFFSNTVRMRWKKSLSATTTRGFQSNIIFLHYLNQHPSWFFDNEQYTMNSILLAISMNRISLTHSALMICSATNLRVLNWNKQLICQVCLCRWIQIHINSFANFFKVVKAKTRFMYTTESNNLFIDEIEQCFS